MHGTREPASKNYIYTSIVQMCDRAWGKRVRAQMPPPSQQQQGHLRSPSLKQPPPLLRPATSPTDMRMQRLALCFARIARHRALSRPYRSKLALQALTRPFLAIRMLSSP